MTTITIAGGTTIVSTHIPLTVAYLVEGTGTLDIVGGGVVSGVITISRSRFRRHGELYHPIRCTPDQLCDRVCSQS